MVCSVVSVSELGANVELMTQTALKKKFPWLHADDVKLASYGQFYTNLENLEYSGIAVNVENSGNSVQPQGAIVTNRQLNRLILGSFYSAMTIELVLAELLCCDCERVFCNSFCILFYIVGSCKCRVSGLVVQLPF